MEGPDDPSVRADMRNDWNARAREDAGYYVAFGRREQSDADFYATATEVINSLESELRRVPAAQRSGWKALEIGCGPGRLMRPMSRHFTEIHGVVSDHRSGVREHAAQEADLRRAGQDRETRLRPGVEHVHTRYRRDRGGDITAEDGDRSALFQSR